MQYQHLFDLHADPVEVMLQKVQIDKNHFEGRVVLVTGGARGIGKQTALGLASLGAKVTIVDRLESGRDVVTAILDKGGEAHFIHRDLSEITAIREIFAEINEKYGEVEILMNNAVHFTIASFLEMSMDEWEMHLRTNVCAAVEASKLALPGMIERDSGIILNMVALEGMAYAAPMSSSKLALRSFMFSLASEIGNSSGVKVMGFAPGLVATPLVEDVFPKYCKRIGVDFEDYVLKLVHNWGYEGLMPAEHCAAGVIYTMQHAENYHGLIADPFLPMEKYGIIKKRKEDPIAINWEKEYGKEISENVTRLKEYIDEVANLNERIESRVRERTANISEEKAMIMELLKELKVRNLELEETYRSIEVQKDMLERSNNELKSFAYVVSHDLKTPIRGIASLTAFIKMDLEGQLDEMTSNNLDLLENRVKRMESLVNGILEYSKVGKVNASTEELDLNDLLLEVKDLINPPEKISITIDTKFPSIKANKTTVQQIFQNLIGNAVKYHDKDNGRVEVSYFSENGHIGFSIADNGPGISPDYHDKIFGMFQTLNSKEDAESTGVGLAIVKKAVEDVGGRIWVESEQGKGSTFKFTLPKS